MTRGMRWKLDWCTLKRHARILHSRALCSKPLLFPKTWCAVSTVKVLVRPPQHLAYLTPPSETQNSSGGRNAPDPIHVVQVANPAWVTELTDWERRYSSDEERMRLALSLARENVLRDGAGPFAAAIFESETGMLVAVGVNRVVPLNNSALHGEMVAFMLAQARLGSYTLAAPGMPRHEVVTSCEPCAMCLGATLWSGVRRLVWGASREDATRLSFDEGPVFPESYKYLEERGIEIVRDVCREEARAVLELYRSRSGAIYNG